MKITGYTRLSDKALANSMRRYMIDRGKAVSMFTFGNPLCDVDGRRCPDKGIAKQGEPCRNPTSLPAFGICKRCRKVTVEAQTVVTITEISP